MDKGKAHLYKAMYNRHTRQIQVAKIQVGIGFQNRMRHISTKMRMTLEKKGDWLSAP